MSGEPEPGHEWRIGELAAATGLSLRALRHYERIGLLEPVRRTSGGHRVYDARGVERLYRICALKSLGVPLKEVAGAGETETLGDLLQRHLEHLDEEVRRVTALRARTRRVIAHLDEPIPSGRLVALIRAMTELERYFTPQQLDRLARRRRALGADRRREVEREWRELGVALRTELDAGATPTSEPVLALARHAQELIDSFTGGDAAMRRALKRLRDERPPQDLAGWDAELLRVLDRALETLDRP